MAITPMPAISAENCLSDSTGSVSLSKSGKTVTSAMCRKPPAVNGIIQDVLASALIKLELIKVFNCEKKLSNTTEKVNFWGF